MILFGAELTSVTKSFSGGIVQTCSPQSASDSPQKRGETGGCEGTPCFKRLKIFFTPFGVKPLWFELLFILKYKHCFTHQDPSNASGFNL